MGYFGIYLDAHAKRCSDILRQIRIGLFNSELEVHRISRAVKVLGHYNILDWILANLTVTMTSHAGHDMSGMDGTSTGSTMHMGM